MKDLSMHVMDIFGNSVRARAGLIELTIEESRARNSYGMTFRDNGCGMDAGMLEKAVNPWFTSRTERKIGLGLSLLKQNAEMCGGHFRIRSTPAMGGRGETVLEVMFRQDHLDRPVAGDLAGAIMIMVSSWPEIDFVYTHRTDSGTYRFDTREVKEILEGVSISRPEMRQALTEMIGENLAEIQAEHAG